MGEQHYPLDFTPQCHQLRWLIKHLGGWQFGEQGLIDVLADSLELTEGEWIEYGAGDGESLPLTIERKCQTNPDYCYLVEIDPIRRLQLKTKFPSASVTSAIRWKDTESPDIVVIDIDGQDSVVMRQMLADGVRPTLLVVEHMDQHFPIGTSAASAIPQWMLGLKLESGHAIQDTAETLHAIATANGYERIGFNRCNSFFVVKERFAELFR